MFRRVNNHNASDGDNVPPQPGPSVPTIQRRSDSFPKDDNAAQQQQQQTDEFGFPLTHRSSSPSLIHNIHASQQVDLENVSRPIRLQRGHSSTAMQHPPHEHNNNNPMQKHQQQNYPQQQIQKRQSSTTTRPYVSRTNSSSSSSTMHKVSSKISTSTKSSHNNNNRPPRSYNNNNSYIRQNSHPSTIATTQSTATSSSRRQKKHHVKISKPNPSRYKNYTFQHPINAPRLSIRTIDMSNRIAFDTRIPTSCNSVSLRNMLEQMDRVRGSRSTFTSIIDETCSSVISGGNASKRKKSSDNPCRISPSPNHMAVLEFMFANSHGRDGIQSLVSGQQQQQHGTNGGNSISTVSGNNSSRVVRQLQWNAAVSIDADPWFDGCYNDEEDSNDTDSLEQSMKNSSLDRKHSKDSNQSSKSTSRGRRRKPRSSHGDGRYIPINPLTTTKSMIPSHSPILTNVKRRLPNRADVGFANPTKEEMARKMDEVKKEAEWEESSPRIVLLASGFSLFNNEQKDETSIDDNTVPRRDIDIVHSSCQDDIQLWAGGSIPGIPFAGRDLVMAYNRNSKFHYTNGILQKDNEEKEKNNNMKDETTISSEMAKDLGRCKNPRSYSVFAPPVDATFSSSNNLWRPRPFMDRPPGMLYFLACPLDLQFDVGDVEPLFCTMACYCLPKSNVGSKKTQHANVNSERDNINTFCGKISEDFFFPAGDWRGIDGSSSFDDANNDDEQQQPQSWRRRKRRAVMSYDPLEVCPTDLHLVIQVYRMNRIHNGERGPSSNKKSIGSKIKKSLIKGKSGRDRGVTQQQIIQAGGSQSNSEDAADLLASFDDSGAQHLTPVCFSITPAFHPDETTQQKHERASLFSFPDTPETNDDFVNRLASLANPHPSTNKANPTSNVDGYTEVFTSYLGKDFTKALLDEPPHSHNGALPLDDTEVLLGPQLLADVMGDCAISFDGPTTLDNGTNRSNHRSKLRRLPPHSQSGYSSSFDIKEVLYLPPRSLPRKYEDDAALCSSTVLNLLYVYPRLIRWKANSTLINNVHDDDYLSIRVQVVEQELPPGQQSFDSTDLTYHSLQAIYNPLSPAGPPLVESLFTKLVKREHANDDKRGENTKTKEQRQDIHLKDEVKIRLPDVLDRRHFLQFSLFSIQCSDGGTKLLAETTVPFIISSKESTSGGRVTTIIPNGLHRIQLSDGLQIHVETRLASSCHISDPSVATVLRDFSVVSSATNSSSSVVTDMDSTSSSSDIIVRASSGFSFLDILTMASGQAVKHHFSTLITANMLNFVSQICPTFYFKSFDMFVNSGSEWHRLVALDKTDALFAIIRSLFEILDKTRTSYQERDCSMLSLQYQRLVKSFLDSFDEPCFALKHSDTEMQYSEMGDSVSERHFNESIESGHTNDDDAYYDVPSSSLNEVKDNRKRVPKYTVKSPKSDISTKTFSRTAFVATRSDQIKAETEMEDYDNTMYGREYFDDDQTVVTLGTITSKADSVFPIILETKSFGNYQNEITKSKSSMSGIEEEISIGWTCGSGIASTSTPPKRSPTAQPKSSTPFSFASKRAEYMANRVNTMAQLVMAPCIAPSVDEMITGSNESDPNKSLGNGNVRVTSQISRHGHSGGNQNPFEPSSDVEEEGATKEVPPYLRGNQSCLKISPILFTPMRQSGGSSMNGEQDIPKSNTPGHLYEMVFSLWVHCWTSFASSIKSEIQVHGTSNIISAWPLEIVHGGSHNPTSNDALVAISFIRNMSFFLPLCLKSLGLRCASSNTTRLIVPMTLLDDNHMQILLVIVETISLGLVREAMSGSSSNANSDQMLTRSLLNSDYMLDFIIGLFPLVHPSQVATLLLAYFNILEECEDPNGKDKRERDAPNLRLCKCARQLRLLAVERLASMPSFARVNFPLKFTGAYPRLKVVASSWTNQSTAVEEDPFQKDWARIERYPQAFWLSELLMNQCLKVCNSSCEMIVMEAKRMAKATKQGTRRGDSDLLLRDDLLRIESLAFHAIVCAYELLIKRQAMDSRFQTISSSTRVAALFTRAVLQQSVNAVSSLAKMNPDQQVRLIWFLCLLYILQEGPDAMVRDELRRFCNPQDNRINDFVHLLKLASVTCQHYVPTDGSLPVIDGLSKEMTQEAFNCLSATVILLIDECFDVLSTDEHELEKFGGCIFDTLLHLLATPQSSVTLLRTLGGSAHALDKFGARIFLKTVGNQLEHWGRIFLTMMNSTELSVRSMAVDFLVSLLCDIYREYGSIESTSLCILSVLPEVAAREIALCNASGLIKSMECVGSSLWPLRRALADVEETNPLDDDRIDEQLLPSLTTFCRTGQAIIDGVLVEMRLRSNSIDFDLLDLNEIAKARRSDPMASFRQQFGSLPQDTLFDADEESVLEVASFFQYETGLLQKLRWLYTLTDLHLAKEQWSEVGETLVLCAHSLVKSLDHLPNLWHPSQFALWNDVHRSPWLSSVVDNKSVMEFANAFLEPAVFLQQKGKVTGHHYIPVEVICSTLTSVIDHMDIAFAEEEGMEDLAYTHLEDLLTMVTAAINTERKMYHSESRSALRRVRASICSKLAKLTKDDVGNECSGAQIYVQVVLHGTKPNRFKESTALPTYFEWDTPSIVRIPKPTLVEAARLKQQNPMKSWEECICQTYTMPLIDALRDDDANHSVVLRMRGSQDPATDESKTYISSMIVQKKSSNSCKSRKFFVRHGQDGITEYTVAHKFPHALSRQRSLITNEMKMTGSGGRK